MKILVTGSTGYLGTRLVPLIHGLSSECAILLRPSSIIRSDFFVLRDLSVLKPSSNNEMSILIGAFDPDVVIHAACNSGLNGDSDFEINETNIDLGMNIIKSLNLQDSLKTFINIDTALPSEVSHYAKSKHQFSFLCKEFAEKSLGKFKFVNLITQIIYGGDSVRAGFISHVVSECIKDSGDLKLTAGYQKRDFIHINDVVNAIKIIILNIKNNNLESQYDLGSGVSRSIRDVVTLIHSLSMSKVNLVFGALPYRSSEPMDLVADISRLKSLGWTPTVKFEEAIQEIILKDDRNAKMSS
jgi:CDP-paratose synthetase